MLLKLGGALAMASGFLARFCPNEIPSKPVARLQLVETQLEALTTALDIFRHPLQDLEQSLNRNQQTRLAAALSMPGAANGDAAAGAAPACDPTPTTVERTIDELNQSVQPNSDTQRMAMAATKQAFGTAARDLDTQCPISLPTAPAERLKAVQARLDAEWRAVLIIRVALENLESALSDEQRVRVNALDFASGGHDNVFGRN
jgi:LTXXQ motif family protein